MQLVLGTYERFLLGYSLPAALEEGCQLKRSFTHAAHQGPVRCLDAGGAWLVSGGQDDQLHIYDLQHNKDQGFVMNPGEGAITCLSLFTPPGSTNPSHLLSGSEDGSIAIWSAGGGWQLLKLMRGHRGPVRDLSVHPSGRLALSVGHDRGLRMWGLAKGRCSYTAKLEAEADAIAFSASGEAYALTCDKLVTLHSVGQEGSLLARLQHDRRAVSLLQQQDGAAVLTGQEDGRLLLWDLRAPAVVAQVAAAHRGRIRAVTGVTPAAGGVGLPLHIASASSDGVVKLWDMRRFGSSSSSNNDNDGACELASVATQGRITGMVLSAPDPPAAGAAAAGDAIGAGGGAADAAEQQQRKAAKKQRKKLQQQQRKQQQEQQQQLGQEMQVDASDEDAAPQEPPRQQQSKKKPLQQQQQQQLKQQQRKKKKLLKQAGGDGTALVPRVQTTIAKKKLKPNKQQRQAAIAAAVGGGVGGGSGGAKAAAGKRRQQLPQPQTAGARMKKQLSSKP